MIKVKGADFKTVLLTDIGDRVYFGQEKVFSDAQYAASKELKKSIESGKLLVLENSPEVNAGFIAPAQVAPTVITAPPPTPDPALALVVEMVNTLTQKISSIESMVTNAPPIATPAVTDANTDVVLGAVAQLQRKMEQVEASINNSPSISASIQDSMKEVVSQVRGLVASGPGVVSQKVVSGPAYVEEVFIPSSKIVVEDMSNHVNLEAKSLGQGNAMTNALSKLSQLNKPTGTK